MAAWALLVTIMLFVLLPSFGQVRPHGGDEERFRDDQDVDEDEAMQYGDDEEYPDEMWDEYYNGGYGRDMPPHRRFRGGHWFKIMSRFCMRTVRPVYPDWQDEREDGQGGPGQGGPGQGGPSTEDQEDKARLREECEVMRQTMAPSFTMLQLVFNNPAFTEKVQRLAERMELF